MRSALLLTASVLAAAGTSSPERGKRIYLEGVSDPARPIVAVSGADRVELPAPLLPCVNCHGSDGRGRPEGGVRPADITPDALGRAADGSWTNGRRRPAYTRMLLTRAVTMGVDAGGTQLDVTMPRYRLWGEDRDDLLAYLDRLGREPEPGVRDDAVVVGVVIPERSTSGAADPRPALAAVLARVNGGGGLYGRRLELRVGESLASVLAPEEPFVVVDLSLDAETTVRAAERLRLPAIVRTRAADGGAGPYVFQLFGGLREQGAALLAHARRSGLEPVAIVTDDKTLALARSLGDERQGLAVVLRGDPSAIAKLSVSAAALLLGTSPSAPVASPTGVPGGRPPLWLMPIEAVGDVRSHTTALPDGPIVLAATGARADDAERSTAAAAAAVLVEAFTRIGRSLTRERLVSELQKFYRFDTGVLPPITWTVTRRVGLAGAWLVEVAPGKRPGPPVWVEP
jgi:Cytochrome c